MACNMHPAVAERQRSSMRRPFKHRDEHRDNIGLMISSVGGAYDLRIERDPCRACARPVSSALNAGG
jgi:hypothetical protein